MRSWITPNFTLLILKTMNRERRKELLWELVDSMFNKVEYWDELVHPIVLTREERDYLYKVVSSFAKQRNITNHILIK